MHCGRNRDTRGVKKVEVAAQSKHSMTHSYTIQPVISADGRLLSPMLVVLQESKGELGPRVRQTMFKPDNLHIQATKSGKVTKALIKTWLQDVYFPSVGNESHLVVDALTQYCDDMNVNEAVSEGAIFELKKIPAGATGKAQPLDVGFFRSWKQLVRRISDRALMEGGVDIFQRNNIIKLQSLIHFQFSAPQYSDMIRYAWYKSWVSASSATSI